MRGALHLQCVPTPRCWCVAQAAINPPDDPLNLFASWDEPEDDFIDTITWEAPTTGDPVIDGYKVYLALGEGSYNFIADVGNALFHVRTWTNQETARYSVSAYNNQGEGPGGIIALRLGQPTITSVDAPFGDVIVHWNGVPFAEDFLVEYRILESSSWGEFISIDVSDTSTDFTIPNIFTDEFPMQFRVSANAFLGIIIGPFSEIFDKHF